MAAGAVRAHPPVSASRAAWLAVALCLCLTPGCATLFRPDLAGVADGLYAGILGQDDPATVRDGGPAYLLAVDGMIEDAPGNPDLLLVGARLYGAYAGAFVTDEARLRRLWDRALRYARRALCLESRAVCDAVDRPFEEFERSLAAAREKDVPVLYVFGATWAGFLQAHADDWRAVADVPKVEALMRRVLALDETTEDGGAHLYMGVLLTQRPASLGGQPQRGRAHFERAIALSGGRNLMAKVLYARHYARLVFDRDLHDRLLREVMEADPEAPGLTLANTLAKQQAQSLLAGSDDYF